MPARAREFTGIAVVTVAVAILATVGILAARQSGISRGESTAAQAWVLPALDGDGHVALADFRGKPLVVNFFASWCVACDIELPGFAHVSEELKDQVQFVGVASLETGDPYVMPRRHLITWWPLATDIGGSNKNGLHRALGDGRSMPMTAFHDAQGKLLDTHIGLLPGLPEPGLRAAIRRFYGDPPGALTGSPTPLATFTRTPLRPRTPGG
jgi:cytochrome c biogenesis protein CcmG/thiol:disulfide interchange protein DsbE